MVIDASVVMAANPKREEDTKPPKSAQVAQDRRKASRFRAFLLTFLKEEYRAVMCDKLYDEWHDTDPAKAPRIANARTWFAQLRRGGAIVRIRADAIYDGDLREQVSQFEIRRNITTQDMTDDVHLIEAAQFTDAIVISDNDTERGRYGSLAQSYHPLKPIVWVNPSKEQAPELWLKNGAPSDEHRKLGYIETLET
jgi:hypothetical protein